MSDLAHKISFDFYLTLSWQGTNTEFNDRLCLSHALPDPIALPKDLVSWCRSAEPDDWIQVQIDSTSLIPDYDPELQLTFNRGGTINEKLALDFTYPGRFIAVADLPSCYRTGDNTSTFARIAAVNQEQLQLDFNHPLAGKTVNLNLEIRAIPLDAELVLLSLDLAGMIRDCAIGLQDTHVWPPATEFTLAALARIDRREDEEFFAEPDLNPFWDRTANKEVAKIYRELIADGARILDLMAGVHSPLQESGIKPQITACAGLNSTELSRNPVCTQCSVFNVNSRTALPYPDASFDVVLIHAAIEYLVQPEFLFTEIARVLIPGGKIIITFSGRSVEAKSIALWRDLHPFERSALIVDYLTAAGLFSNLHGYSTSTMREIGEYHDTSPICTVWADRNDTRV